MDRQGVVEGEMNGKRVITERENARFITRMAMPIFVTIMRR